ncbi:hypothetical protein D3C87_1635490 [compost metagenome]
MLQRVIRGDDYQDLRTQDPWDAWQARAALAQPAPVQPNELTLTTTIADLAQLTGRKMLDLMTEAARCGITVTANQPFDALPLLCMLAAPVQQDAPAPSMVGDAVPYAVHAALHADTSGKGAAASVMTTEQEFELWDAADELAFDTWKMVLRAEIEAMGRISGQKPAEGEKV